MKVRSYEVFEMNADLCRALAHPSRLIIIDLLGKREMCVGEIAAILEAQPATVSQHLRLLRDKHIVKARKDGQTVHYRLAIPRMTEACHIIREVLLDNLRRRGAIAEDVTPDNLVEE